MHNVLSLERQIHEEKCYKCYKFTTCVFVCPRNVRCCSFEYSNVSLWIKMIHLIPGFTIDFFSGDIFINRATIEPNTFSALAISTTFLSDMIELSSGVKLVYTGQLVSRVFNFCLMFSITMDGEILNIRQAKCQSKC